jgi:uncharacterized membrane protein
MSTSRALFLALVITMVIQCAIYLPKLPPHVASHFDGAGNPNGWSSKGGLLAIYATVVILYILIFVVMPGRLLRLPASWINLPHKNYWLAPERREIATSMLAARMQWFGIASLLFMMGIFQLVFEANSRDPRQLSSWALWWIVGYVVASLVWVLELYRAFRPPRQTKEPG